MPREDERFLARWSRLKRAQAHESEDAAEPVAPASTPPGEERGEAVLPQGNGEAALPQGNGEAALPPVGALTPESDFTVFMKAKVADGLRRAALKKLFLHPEINIPDPFEPFSGDWTGGESIPNEMLGPLLQAREALLRPPDPLAGQAGAGGAELAAQAHDPEPEVQMPERSDDPGRQDA
jgi:hypothetical protein